MLRKTAAAVAVPTVSKLRMAAAEAAPTVSKLRMAAAEAAQIPGEIEKIMDNYAEVFNDDTLKPMKIDPIRLKQIDNPNLQPKKIKTARAYPRHMEAAARRTEEKLIKMGIIRPVTIPTLYCHPGFMVPKKLGDLLRLVTDLTELNKNLDRPVHPSGNVDEVLSKIPRTAKYLIFLDAKMGYYQVPIHPDDQELTTFLLPSGKYCYRRAPQGLSVSSDEWCQASDTALRYVPNMCKMVDDMCLYAETK